MLLGDTMETHRHYIYEIGLIVVKISLQYVWSLHQRTTATAFKDWLYCQESTSVSSVNVILTPMRYN